ncbi:Peptidoglycan-binding LysM (plasmid) [Xylanimonas cellulosilytica DSM 15894]|uniref:Peptidoglycan-binding LysM n=1 Tax=Xylanimonas cellulosilytica (strain DSM 15894 / JCM 12276 / CECT 5975 / KCTC 9989 / LMG 20990 / NBRC 107835 / XIL07) TaxID=446471 RepID=D1C0V9_XYLCX|nr:LysM peptidoglycan-binding domain-containing protein [Xylanimonas cellulosilytica]ACZ32425.1 Peptidoglycan-binding LysM [Xylanimonas cellulosilytica DSM 15894]
MSTLRRRLVGLAAVLLIVGIVVGLPVVLLAVGANPLEAGLPSFSDITGALTSPDDGSLLVGLIEVVAWLAWAFLTLSLLVEIVSRARGIRAPRMPGLRMPQNAARGLVGAAVMLFVSVPVANALPATAAAATLEPTHVATITAPANPAAAVPVASPAAPVSVAPEQGPGTVAYTVQPHESLWSIAASQLGDGHRFTEIVDLNQELLGGKANFIKPGWVLQIPAPVEAPATTETVTVERGDTLSSIARDELGDADRYPEIFEASRDIEQPGGAHLSDPNVIQPGWTVAVPAAATATPAPSAPSAVPTVEAPEAEATPTTPSEPTPTLEPAAPHADAEAPAAVAPAAPAPQQATAPAETTAAPTASAATESAVAEREQASAVHDGLEEEVLWQAATAAGIGTVLAAGVLAVVARRRRNQQRLRRPGQPMPLPLGEAAVFEQEIRAAADPLSVETVDVALRSLAHHCAETGKPLPTVRAARLTADRFELYLEDGAHLPAPWIDTAEEKIWTLEVAAAVELGSVNRGAVPAPYPSLVTIGHDEEAGHVFLNLEHLGALGITGDDPSTREILAALAIELATSVWADDLQVTLVGAFPELEDALQTGRIRYLPTVGRLVDELSTRAQDDRQALAAAGVADLYSARVTGAVPDAWDPEIVLLAGNITDRQRAQLTDLVAELPHVALATITSGLSVGEWTLEATPGADQAVLSPIGLQIQPQRLPMEQYGHLLQLVALADVDELDGDAPADPTVAEVEAIAPVDEPPAPASAMPAVTLEMLEVNVGIDPAVSDPASIPVTVVDDVEQSGAAAPADDQVEAVESEISATLDEPVAAHDEEVPMPTPAGPRILVLGPVDLTGAVGSVEDSKRARLLEYAAYLALNPRATHTAIDDAIWPDRRTEDNLNTRNTATSKLRRWVGQDEDGNDYLPRHQAGGGYGFSAGVTTDASDWDQLLAGDPLGATTENLEAALRLVRGIPFEGTHRKRYAWAEPTKQRLISEIVDTSYSLAKRRLMEGRWRAAEAAVVVGLRIEPAQENLWRIRILAAHESRNPDLEAEAIERLLTITEQLECDLEPETEQLLAALKNPGADFDRLMAHAL